MKWSEENSLNTEQNAKFSAEIMTKVQVFKTCKQILQFCPSFAPGKTKTNCQMRVLVLNAADWTSASV